MASHLFLEANRDPSQEWPRYSLYGIVLASDFSFATYQIPTQNQADLFFTCQESAPLTIDWPSLTPVNIGKAVSNSGRPELLIYKIDDVVVLRMGDKIDFYRWPDFIICHLKEPSYEYLVEPYLLGIVLPIRLENAGILTLHASASIVARETIGFMATSRSGKTSLAASFTAAGYPLLTDDILAIREDDGSFWSLPAYPQMRMWPEQAEHFLGNDEMLPIVHPDYPKKMVVVGTNGFGTFCDQPTPLQALFVPQRIEGPAACEIIKVPPAEAMFLLIRNHHFVSVFHELPNLPQRLDFLQRLASQVPIYKLRYPAGYDHLPQVRQEILDHLG